MKNKDQGWKESFKELATAVGYISLVTVMIFLLLICYILFTGCSSTRHTNKEKGYKSLDSSYKNEKNEKNESWKTDRSTTDIKTTFDTTVKIKGKSINTVSYDKDSLLRRLQYYDLLFDLEGNAVTIHRDTTVNVGKNRIHLSLHTKDTSVNVKGSTTTHIQNNVDLKTSGSVVTTQEGKKTLEERKTIKTTERKSDYTKWAIWTSVIVVVGLIIFLLIKRVNFRTLINNVKDSFKKK